MTMGMNDAGNKFLNKYSKRTPAAAATGTPTPPSKVVTKDTIKNDFGAPAPTTATEMLTKVFDGPDSLMTKNVTGPDLKMPERLENLKTILTAMDDLELRPNDADKQKISEQMEELVASLITTRTTALPGKNAQLVSDKLVESVIKQIKDTKSAKYLVIGSLISSTGAVAPDAATPKGLLAKSLSTLFSNDTNKTGSEFKENLATGNPSLSKLATSINVPKADGSGDIEPLTAHLLTHVKDSNSFDVLLGFDSTFIADQIKNGSLAICKDDKSLNEDRTESFLSTFKDALSEHDSLKQAIETVRTTIFDENDFGGGHPDQQRLNVGTKLNVHFSAVLTNSKTNTEDLTKTLIEKCISYMGEDEDSHVQFTELLTSALGTDKPKAKKALSECINNNPGTDLNEILTSFNQRNTPENNFPESTVVNLQTTIQSELLTQASKLPSTTEDEITDKAAALKEPIQEMVKLLIDGKPHAEETVKAFLDGLPELTKSMSLDDMLTITDEIKTQLTNHAAKLNPVLSSINNVLLTIQKSFSEDFNNKFLNAETIKNTSTTSTKEKTAEKIARLSKKDLKAIGTGPESTAVKNLPSSAKSSFAWNLNSMMSSGKVMIKGLTTILQGAHPKANDKMSAETIESLASNTNILVTTTTPKKAGSTEMVTSYTLSEDFADMINEHLMPKGKTYPIDNIPESVMKALAGTISGTGNAERADFQDTTRSGNVFHDINSFLKSIKMDDDSAGISSLDQKPSYENLVDMQVGSNNASIKLNMFGEESYNKSVADNSQKGQLFTSVHTSKNPVFEQKNQFFEEPSMLSMSKKPQFRSNFKANCMKQIKGGLQDRLTAGDKSAEAIAMMATGTKNIEEFNKTIGLMQLDGKNLQHSGRLANYILNGDKSPYSKDINVHVNNTFNQIVGHGLENLNIPLPTTTRKLSPPFNKELKEKLTEGFKSEIDSPPLSDKTTLMILIASGKESMADFEAMNTPERPAPEYGTKEHKTWKDEYTQRTNYNRIVNGANASEDTSRLQVVKGLLTLASSNAGRKESASAIYDQVHVSKSKLGKSTKPVTITFDAGNQSASAIAAKAANRAAADTFITDKFLAFKNNPKSFLSIKLHNPTNSKITYRESENMTGKSKGIQLTGRGQKYTKEFRTSFESAVKNGLKDNLNSAIYETKLKAQEMACIVSGTSSFADFEKLADGTLPISPANNLNADEQIALYHIIRNGEKTTETDNSQKSTSVTVQHSELLTAEVRQALFTNDTKIQESLMNLAINQSADKKTPSDMLSALPSFVQTAITSHFPDTYIPHQDLETLIERLTMEVNKEANEISMIGSSSLSGLTPDETALISGGSKEELALLSSKERDAKKMNYLDSTKLMDKIKITRQANLNATKKAIDKLNHFLDQKVDPASGKVSETGEPRRAIFNKTTVAERKLTAQNLNILRDITGSVTVEDFNEARTNDAFITVSANVLAHVSSKNKTAAAEALSSTNLKTVVYGANGLMDRLTSDANDVNKELFEELVRAKDSGHADKLLASKKAELAELLPLITNAGHFEDLFDGAASDTKIGSEPAGNGDDNKAWNLINTAIKNKGISEIGKGAGNKFEDAQIETLLPGLDLASPMGLAAKALLENVNFTQIINPTKQNTTATLVEKQTALDKLIKNEFEPTKAAVSLFNKMKGMSADKITTALQETTDKLTNQLAATKLFEEDGVSNIGLIGPRPDSSTPAANKTGWDMAAKLLRSTTIPQPDAGNALSDGEIAAVLPEPAEATMNAAWIEAKTLLQGMYLDHNYDPISESLGTKPTNINADDHSAQAWDLIQTTIQSTPLPKGEGAGDTISQAQAEAFLGPKPGNREGDAAYDSAVNRLKTLSVAAEIAQTKPGDSVEIEQEIENIATEQTILQDIVNNLINNKYGIDTNDCTMLGQIASTLPAKNGSSFNTILASDHKNFTAQTSITTAAGNSLASLIENSGAEEDELRATILHQQSKDVAKDIPLEIERFANVMKKFPKTGDPQDPMAAQLMKDLTLIFKNSSEPKNKSFVKSYGLDIVQSIALPLAIQLANTSKLETPVPKEFLKLLHMVLKQTEPNQSNFRQLSAIHDLVSGLMADTDTLVNETPTPLTAESKDSINTNLRDTGLKLGALHAEILQNQDIKKSDFQKTSEATLATHKSKISDKITAIQGTSKTLLDMVSNLDHEISNLEKNESLFKETNKKLEEAKSKFETMDASKTADIEVQSKLIKNLKGKTVDGLKEQKTKLQELITKAQEAETALSPQLQVSFEDLIKADGDDEIKAAKTSISDKLATIKTSQEELIKQLDQIDATKKELVENMKDLIGSLKKTGDTKSKTTSFIITLNKAIEDSMSINVGDESQKFLAQVALNLKSALELIETNSDDLTGYTDLSTNLNLLKNIKFSDNKSYTTANIDAMLQGTTSLDQILQSLSNTITAKSNTSTAEAKAELNKDIDLGEGKTTTKVAQLMEAVEEAHAKGEEFKLENEDDKNLIARLSVDDINNLFTSIDTKKINFNILLPQMAKIKIDIAKQRFGANSETVVGMGLEFLGKWSQNLGDVTQLDWESGLSDILSLVKPGLDNLSNDKFKVAYEAVLTIAVVDTFTPVDLGAVPKLNFKANIKKLVKKEFEASLMKQMSADIGKFFATNIEAFSSKSLLTKIDEHNKSFPDDQIDSENFESDPVSFAAITTALATIDDTNSPFPKLETIMTIDPDRLPGGTDIPALLNPKIAPFGLKIEADGKVSIDLDAQVNVGDSNHKQALQAAPGFRAELINLHQAFTRSPEMALNPPPTRNPSKLIDDQDMNATRDKIVNVVPVKGSTPITPKGKTPVVHVEEDDDDW